MRPVLPAFCALAAAMGVGRFVYTPILPLMQAQAGVSPRLGAGLATANYAGYLIGAALAIVVPALARSRRVLGASLVTLVGSLALMPLFPYAVPWLTLRLLAGLASALIFVAAAQAVVGLRHGGWAFAGVGGGIALSGVLVLVTADGWRSAWWASAVLAALLAVGAWSLELPSPPPVVAGAGWSRPFVALLISYTLEGVGYIIAGTFLVAAIAQRTPGPLGAGAWILVGLCALPSAVLLARVRRWSRPALYLAVLIAQAFGIALPALWSRPVAALLSAALFGCTFLGAVTVAFKIGADLGVARGAALLTTVYAAGQIAGPLLVTPLLHHSYQPALLTSAAIVACAAFAIRYCYPVPAPSKTAQSARV